MQTLDDLIGQTTKDIVAESKGPVSVVLIGSAARGKRSEQSDIDLLVITEDRPSCRFHRSSFHVQQISKADFLKNLTKGEDFEGWCVRFGIPLHDDGAWQEILNSPLSQQWPDWRLKVAHGARRLFLANTLMEIGDKDAASEELLYVLGHVARGLLLKAQIFPQSRPELAEQIEKLGHKPLAILHEQLRTADKVSLRTLGLAVRYSKKLLCHLDRELYRRSSAEYRSRRRLKAARRRGPLPTSSVG